VIAFAQFPITLLNKIEKLRMLSFLGVCGIAVFIISFVVYYVDEIYKGTSLRNMEMLPDDLFKAVATIPNVIFSLTFQANLFPIFKGLEDSCDQRMKRVVCLGVWTCISCYLLLGFLGFSITHKKVISPNFLE
jgi:amino acid permease